MSTTPHLLIKAEFQPSHLMARQYFGGRHPKRDYLREITRALPSIRRTQERTSPRLTRVGLVRCRRARPHYERGCLLRQYFLHSLQLRLPLPLPLSLMFPSSRRSVIVSVRWAVGVVSVPAWTMADGVRRRPPQGLQFQLLLLSPVAPSPAPALAPAPVIETIDHRVGKIGGRRKCP